MFLHPFPLLINSPEHGPPKWIYFLKFKTFIFFIPAPLKFKTFKMKASKSDTVKTKNLESESTPFFCLQFSMASPFLFVLDALLLPHLQKAALQACFSSLTAQMKLPLS